MMGVGPEGMYSEGKRDVNEGRREPRRERKNGGRRVVKGKVARMKDWKTL